ncbi:MAG: hypothetical protein RIQ75_158, partial [Pseudomonadota bacterium]
LPPAGGKEKGEEHWQEAFHPDTPVK